MTGLSHGQAQELHLLVGGPIETARHGYSGDLEVAAVMVPIADLERARELAAIQVSDTDPDSTDGPDITIPRATIAQLRASNTARQERIWELEDRLATLRQASPLKNPMAVWDMFRRENRERIRLLERNRILTGKVLRRAQTTGQLRAANRELLAQITGGSHKLPE